MTVDFVIDLISRILDSCEKDRYKHILEGTASFYAGVDSALSVILILLRSIKTR